MKKKLAPNAFLKTSKPPRIPGEIVTKNWNFSDYLTTVLAIAFLWANIAYPAVSRLGYISLVILVVDIMRCRQKRERISKKRFFIEYPTLLAIFLIYLYRAFPH
jgi:hypothetical protein